MVPMIMTTKLPMLMTMNMPIMIAMFTAVVLIAMLCCGAIPADLQKSFKTKGKSTILSGSKNIFVLKTYRKS